MTLEFQAQNVDDELLRPDFGLYQLADALNGVHLVCSKPSIGPLKEKRLQFLRALIETASKSGMQPDNWIIQP